MSWLDLHRAMRAAGWRHSMRYVDSGRDEDGAPWDDGLREHTWKRASEEISAYGHPFDGTPTGWVTYCPDPDVGDPDSISISVGIAVARGPEWLRQAIAPLGILESAVSNTDPGLTLEELAELLDVPIVDDRTSGRQGICGDICPAVIFSSAATEPEIVCHLAYGHASDWHEGGKHRTQWTHRPNPGVTAS